jgi:hypothetical protein
LIADKSGGVGESLGRRRKPSAGTVGRKAGRNFNGTGCRFSSSLLTSVPDRMSTRKWGV